jgi:hypothetical protein
MHAGRYSSKSDPPPEVNNQTALFVRIQMREKGGETNDSLSTGSFRICFTVDNEIGVRINILLSEASNKGRVEFRKDEGNTIHNLECTV